MSAKDLIADIYNTHCKDHTASDFEICRNPLCEMAREAELSIAALQARVAELERIPDYQKKACEFTDVFERQCRATLYGDGSGCLEYSHPDGWTHAFSFETVAEFLLMDAAKMKEACNL
jgi:hypothetical protein